MSQWHSVKAGRYGSRLYVWVDSALSTEAMLAHAYPHTSSNATLLLGTFVIQRHCAAIYSYFNRKASVDNIVLCLQTAVERSANVLEM